MHSRKILTVLVGGLILTLNTAFVFQVRAPFLASEGEAISNVLGRVEQNLNNLNKVVHTRVPANEKVQVLRQTLTEIESLRRQGGVQSVDKEIYMDYSVESLDHVARDPAFSREKCSEYKARIMNDFEPYSEKAPAHPALKRSYQIIEGLCS